MKAVLLLAVAALLTAAGWYVRESAAQDQASVSVGSATVAKGGTTTVTLTADKMPEPGLNVWVIDVDYDPAELSVVECQTIVAPVSVSCMDFAENVQFMGSGTDGGITGHVSIGTITFQAGETNGTSIVRVTLHVLSDTDGTSLLPSTMTNDGSITITGVVPTEEPTEPLPGLDDTPEPTETATPGGPMVTATATPTLPGPVSTATPTATIEVPPPGPGAVEVLKYWDDYDYEDIGVCFCDGPMRLDGWLIRLYDGGSCEGAPRATDLTTALFDGLEPGVYSVAEDARVDWVRVGPETFCVPVVVDEGEVETVEFYNRPMHTGDVNKDGMTNAVDSTILLQLVVRRLRPDDLIRIFGAANAVRLDVNEDFEHTALDALIMLQHDAGYIDTLPLVCVAICALR